MSFYDCSSPTTSRPVTYSVALNWSVICSNLMMQYISHSPQCLEYSLLVNAMELVGILGERTFITLKQAF